MFKGEKNKKYIYVVKVLLLLVMKGSYIYIYIYIYIFFFFFFFFYMHAMSILTISMSYNMHLFLPYLLKNSQTIHSTIHFSKPLLYMTLIYSNLLDWSHFHFIMPVMPDKTVFLSTVLLCVQLLPGKQPFYRSKSGT